MCCGRGGEKLKKTIFTALLLGISAVFSFSHTHAGDQNLANGEYVAAVRKQPRDHTELYWFVTKSGYIAATEEELLDCAIFWAVFGDDIKFASFVNSTPLVFPLKGGMRVRIEEFSYGDKIKIRLKGSAISMWTVREAVGLELPM